MCRILCIGSYYSCIKIVRNLVPLFGRAAMVIQHSFRDSAIVDIASVILRRPSDILSRSSVRLLINEEWPIVIKTAQKGNFPVRFSRSKSIGARLSESLSTYVEFCLCYVNILTRIFDHSVSFPGLYGGLYGENLPHKFKKVVRWFLESQLRTIT